MTSVIKILDLIPRIKGLKLKFFNSFWKLTKCVKSRSSFQNFTYFPVHQIQLVLCPTLWLHCVNLFTLNISIINLLSAGYAILMMLVQRI